MARFEKLKKTWQTQGGISPDRFEQLGDQVRSSSGVFQRTIRRRDAIETIAAVGVILGAMVALPHATSWVDGLGYLTIIGAAILIAVVLWRARGRQPEQLSAANLRQHIDHEIAALQRQVHILRNVAWWYLLPIYVGLTLVEVGVFGPQLSWPMGGTLLLSQSLCAVVFMAVWRMNQRAVKQQLEPILGYYLELREAIDDDDDERLLAVGEPPTSRLLAPNPRYGPSPTAKRIWVALMLIAAGLVVAGGYVWYRAVDARTGVFLIICAPVVVLLLVVISGVWRPSDRGA